MKVNITGKNFKVYPALEDKIEKKFEKLGKYFSDDITANVVLSQERGKDKIEATINAKGTVFRSEEVTMEVHEGIDKVIDKLSRQMSKYKGKLQKRYNDNKALKFEFVPELETAEEEAASEARVVKTKKFDLRPMDTEEAILQMELLDHNFYVFLNMETDSVNVVYKRNDGDYGLLETSY
ncbi:MAG: ribosome-associated translation inhibitor RaiA [Eubacterium sp.]|nr:ribosome-associated translation inhibitor RaiA [Eubacterium sp.]